jgi:hypothetical protein
MRSKKMYGQNTIFNHKNLRNLLISLKFFQNMVVNIHLTSLELFN